MHVDISKRPPERADSMPNAITVGTAKTSFFNDINDPCGCFQKIGIPQNGWFVMENPIKMDDLRVPLFSETPMLKLIGFILNL